MSFGIKEVSRSRRCPICGHDHWCGYYPSPDGEIIICKRGAEVNAQKNQGIMGTDGHFYMCVGISRRDNYCFMEANDLMAAMEQKGVREYTPKMRELEYVDPVEQLPDGLLDKYYRAMLSLLKLEDIHREYLYKEGWTDEMISKYGIVSFPEKDFSRYKFRKNVRLKNPYRKRLASETLAKLGYPSKGLLGLPGAFLDKKEEWTFSGRSGILFPQYNAKHQIVGLRIRMDYMDINDTTACDANGTYFIEDGEKWYLVPMKGAYKVLPDGTRSFRSDGLFKGKYRNFSSFHADEKEEEKYRIVNVYKWGVESGNKLSFYTDISRDDMYIAYITEGEKKGAFANYTMRAPFISLPGVDSWKLLLKGKVGERPVDILKENGCRIIVVAFDADKATNATVLKKETDTASALKKEGFILGVASWDISLGKGIDDLLAGGYKPTYEVY